ncbi:MULTISPECIES: disulfide bond formation protein B [Rhodomicrobium]|uniref:disulfide bond formation protein B n=1 Tax=Rhodomicrobium TaxID=1068 RepID=UPI000B4B251A|nr:MULTISPECIES: disulfide bond formation protein B [Rhodomicrobium]
MPFKVIASAPVRRPIGRRDLALAIALLSAAGVGGALAIEYIGGIAPCPLCLDQRIAYYAAIPLALVAFALWPGLKQASRIVFAVIAIGFLVNAGLGVYHAGIEWHWWAGPDACSGIAPLAVTPGDLLESLKRPRVVRCDEAALRIFGLSLAGYSALLSLFLAALALIGAAKAPHNLP